MGLQCLSLGSMLGLLLLHDGERGGSEELVEDVSGSGPDTELGDLCRDFLLFLKVLGLGLIGGGGFSICSTPFSILYKFKAQLDLLTWLVWSTVAQLTSRTVPLVYVLRLFLKVHYSSSYYTGQYTQ